MLFRRTLALIPEVVKRSQRMRKPALQKAIALEPPVREKKGLRDYAAALRPRIHMKMPMTATTAPAMAR
jgi:hypothetical protein